MATKGATTKAATAPAAVPVLPWLRVPVSVEVGAGVPLARVKGLDPRLKRVLEESLEFRELFPVQAAVWSQLAGGLSTAHDMCICAPTGSGKTLAYALPLVNALATRSAGSGSGRLLRGLVVVPTRDLAQQVHTLLAALCRSLGLVAGLAAAQVGVAAEAVGIVGRPWDGGGGGADVLVATPGRLIAHVQSTPGFSLRQLQVLVVDETDRLLRQRYQDWLPRVLQQLAPAGRSACSGACGGADWPSLPYGDDRVVKLIVSATLTQDPSKLSRLDLHCPRFVALGGSGADGGGARYSLPPRLQQLRLVAAAARKPVALLALLRRLEGQPTLLFASSLETTRKLFLLLSALPATSGRVAEYSSHLPPPTRTANLAAFRSGRVSLLVASDAMARGMDVSNVSNVVNYDTPVYPKAYVHRAGRTARAGRQGRVITLVRPEEMHHFRSMLRKLRVVDAGGETGVEGAGGDAGGDAMSKADRRCSVAELKLGREEFEVARPLLASALAQVRDLLEADAAGAAGAAEPGAGGGAGAGGGVRAGVGGGGRGDAGAPPGAPGAGKAGDGSEIGGEDGLELSGSQQSGGEVGEGDEAAVSTDDGRPGGSSGEGSAGGVPGSEATSCGATASSSDDVEVSSSAATSTSDGSASDSSDSSDSGEGVTLKAARQRGAREAPHAARKRPGAQPGVIDGRGNVAKLRRVGL